MDWLFHEIDEISSLYAHAVFHNEKSTLNLTEQDCLNVITTYISFRRGVDEKVESYLPVLWRFATQQPVAMASFPPVSVARVLQMIPPPRPLRPAGTVPAMPAGTVPAMPVTGIASNVRGMTNAEAVTFASMTAKRPLSSTRAVCGMKYNYFIPFTEIVVVKCLPFASLSGNFFPLSYLIGPN